jgi:hypothetical protein
MTRDIAKRLGLNNKHSLTQSIAHSRTVKTKTLEHEELSFVFFKFYIFSDHQMVC